jgi:aryl-alcohol dehydrogenase-like predicted oxidoreductase
VPVCRELGIGIVAYSPLGRGFLTGAWTSREDLDPSDRRHTYPRFQEGAFEQVGALQGLRWSNFAVAWAWEAQ